MVRMYRRNLTEKNNAKDRTRSSVGRPRALAGASGSDLHPWRTKTRLGAAAAPVQHQWGGRRGNTQ